MQSLQLVIACAGKGSRFAASVGSSNIPYPKHLATIGDKSILQTNIEGSLQMLPVGGITVIINSQLADRYIPHLQKLQAQHPDLPITYIVQPETIGDWYAAIRSELQTNLRTLDGSPSALPEGVSLALGYGDSITTGLPDQMKGFRDVIATRPQGEKINVYNTNTPDAHAIFQISTLDRFSESLHSDTEMFTAAYGINSWNINDEATRRSVENQLYPHEGTPPGPTPPSHRK